MVPRVVIFQLARKTQMIIARPPTHAPSGEPLEGKRDSKTLRQLTAAYQWYDVRGSIKGRARRQRVRKNRTLRVLEPVQTPGCIAYNCLEPQQVEPLATPTGTEGQDDTVGSKK
jgi:hypothetical protein